MRIIPAGSIVSTLVLAGGILLSPVTACLAQGQAPDVEKLVSEALVGDLRELLSHDVVQMSIKAQNARHASLSQAEIDALDKTWRAEREAAVQPLVARTLASPASYFLLRKQGAAGGLFTEIFLMDDKGLNVGQSAVTSDYWQGDEAKFQKTFPSGPDAVFIDEAEWHEGSGTWRAQVNIAVADQATGAVIGAATFEINLTELARRAGV